MTVSSVWSPKPRDIFSLPEVQLNTANALPSLQGAAHDLKDFTAPLRWGSPGKRDASTFFSMLNDVNMALRYVSDADARCSTLKQINENLINFSKAMNDLNVALIDAHDSGLFSLLNAQQRGDLENAKRLLQQMVSLTIKPLLDEQSRLYKAATPAQQKEFDYGYARSVREQAKSLRDSILQAWEGRKGLYVGR